jgi:hypothetical protein
MQSDLQRELENLGFTEKQARIYIALLHLGKSGAMQLSLAVGIPRATCYDVLQQLVTQGLVLSDDSMGQQLFIAEPPERILSLLRLQSEEMTVRLKRAEEFVPHLTALSNSGISRPKVRVLADFDEIVQVGAEPAYLTESILQIVAMDHFLALQTPTTLKNRLVRLQTLKPHGRAILVSNKKHDPPVGVDFEIRTLPPDLLDMKGEMTVCGDRVLIASFDGGWSAVEIVSASLAETCRQALELTWQRAGELEKQFQGRG